MRALNHSIPSLIVEPPETEAHMIYDDSGKLRTAFTWSQLKASSNKEGIPKEESEINIDQSETGPPGEKKVVLDPKYEKMIKADEDRIILGLGDDGEPVLEIPSVTKEQVRQVMKKEAFNRLLSDRISLTRKIPDARHNLCVEVKYDENLPSASVIIVFINEAWSTLLRTVHSTLMRSPENYLKEIILVDDCSTREELKEKLDYYLKTRLPEKVKLVRLTERNGLIKARLAGARVATGDVLVFLDAHCECVVGWLEPMLHRIKEQRSAVVCPIIDVINDETFAYMFSSDHKFQIGSFTWSGHFTWIPVPNFEHERRGSEISPTRSPTMAGGLFAINRIYFWEIGSYDSDMEVWGGENLEMSFRIWQCGGSLEIIPCSRVGHIFRSFHPYSFPGRKDTHGINTARMAEVWMDDYKRLFYLYRPDLKDANIGDISVRKQLREQLKCNSFHWFLKNVVPQKFILDEEVQAYGRIKTAMRNYCFDNLNKPEDKAHDIGLYNCHNWLYASQYFSLSNKGELRRDELCAEVHIRSINIPGLIGGAKGNVTLVQCSGEFQQVWTYKQKMITHVDTGYCIHSFGAAPESLLTVAVCRPNDSHFQWIWEYVRSAEQNVSFVHNM